MAKPDIVIASIVKLLFEENAMSWSIQDKGALTAAVKLQLSEQPREQGSER